MHPLLARQLRTCGLGRDQPPTGEAWRALLDRVDAAYRSADDDRYTFEHAIATCSAEIQELQERVISERDLLRASLASMGDAFCVLRSDGTVDLANPAADRLVGVAGGTLVDRDFRAIVLRGAGAGQDETLTLLAKCIEEARSCRCDDARFTRVDGTSLPVAFALSPLVAEGMAARSVLTFRDTSERKMAEDALRASESRFRAVFQSAGVGILRLDLDWRIAECNGAYAAMLGYAPGDLVGRSLRSLVNPADGDITETSAASGGGLRPPPRWEGRMVHADGSAVWVVASPSYVRNELRQPLFSICIVENITHQKHLEVTLRHAQKLESVGLLAAGVAHEINTPVQFVGDNLHFLNDAFESLLAAGGKARALLVDKAPELRPVLERLAQEADADYIAVEVPRAIAQSLDGIARVAKIVLAMKQFSHPDRGETQTAVDLNAAIESTLTVARNEIKRVAEVEVALGALPPVVCHASDLNQVFLNLLVNAAHAIGDVVGDSGRRGTIRVRTWAEEGNAVIAIADTGAGIPENIRQRIFDPFFTTKEVGKGTGQGLALARAMIVDKHQGSLSFESEVGKGTEFLVRIPLDGVRTVEASR